MLKSPEDKAATLRSARDLWEMLLVFEPLRAAHKGIRDALDACLWPTSPFVRETLVGAFECDFHGFAPQTNQDIQDASCSLTVKPVEDLHRNLNVQAKLNYNGNLCRNGRWHVAQTCNVLRDIDRKPPPVTVEDRKVATKKQLNNHMYETTDKDYSLGHDVHKDLLNAKEISPFNV